MAGKVQRSRRTTIGPVTILEVEGEWTTEDDHLFLAHNCDGITWKVPARRGLTCDWLAPLAERLKFLRVRARKPIDDAALAALSALRFLDATTKARNALDLSGMKDLGVLFVDDRDGLSWGRGEHLAAMTLYGTRRDPGDLPTGAPLVKIHLEAARGHIFDLACQLPAVQHLRLVDGKVTTFAGLDAPQLATLSLDDITVPEVLDLAPLEGLKALKFVTLAPTSDVLLRNERWMSERGVQLSVNRRAQLS